MSSGRSKDDAHGSSHQQYQLRIASHMQNTIHQPVFFEFRLSLFRSFSVFLIADFYLSHNHRFLDFFFVLHNVRDRQTDERTSIGRNAACLYDSRTCNATPAQTFSIYTVSQKNAPTLKRYSSKLQGAI